MEKRIYTKPQMECFEASVDVMQASLWLGEGYADQEKDMLSNTKRNPCWDEYEN